MFVELSHVLRPGMPNFPDAPPERLEVLERQERGDAANTSSARHFMHNGTHIDAPFHFDSAGPGIEALPLSSFIYEHPVLLELPKGPGEEITLADLERRDIDGADALLIRTGFDALRSSDPAAYRVLFPGLKRDAAAWLRRSFPSLKAVVLDFLSVDNYFTGLREGYPSHHELLSASSSPMRPLLIVEDADLRPVSGKRLLRVFALPLRFAGAEAAPVSLVAEIDRA
jgi:kynurenine formamidase